MSLHYILDGYNVLHSDRRWIDIPREKRRLDFLKLVESSKPAKNGRTPVTVVLDGFAASLNDIRLKGVRLVFSGERDADTVIKEMVSKLTHPKEAVVVTNDRDIRSAVRRAGAGIMDSVQFFTLKDKVTTPRSGAKLDSDSANSINDEFKRLWKVD